MKAIIRFKRHRLFLSGRDEILTAIHGSDYKVLFDQFSDWLRSEYKHRGNEAAYDIRQKLFDMANELNIPIE